MRQRPRPRSATKPNWLPFASAPATASASDPSLLSLDELFSLDPEILDAAAFKVLEDPEHGDAFRASARGLIEAKQRLSGISALFTPDQP